MSSADQTPAPDSGRKLFFGLFIFPLLIAVGMALLLCSVVFLTSEKETPETLVASIKSGVKGKRWQKAFELSNELNRRPNSATPAVLNDVLHIFNPSNGYDSKTRAYMALALARFQDPRATTALEQALAEDGDEVKLYALWSLAQTKHAPAAPNIRPLLDDANPEIRKTAAYALGVLGDAGAASSLRAKLTDAVADVRWNAALALARLKDAAGADILRAMLDRSALENELKLAEDQIEPAMTNAMKGLVLINDGNSVKILESIAASDRNLKVRQAAMDALKALKA